MSVAMAEQMDLDVGDVATVTVTAATPPQPVAEPMDRASAPTESKPEAKAKKHTLEVAEPVVAKVCLRPI